MTLQKPRKTEAKGAITDLTEADMKDEAYEKWRYLRWDEALREASEKKTSFESEAPGLTGRR